MGRRLQLRVQSVFGAGMHRRKQGGVAAVELAFVLPVLLALVLGLVFYGLMFLVQQTLAMAAAEGSRAAMQYQPSLAQRVTAAEQTARNSLPAFVRNRMVANDVQATSAPCAAPAGFECITVQVRFALTGGTTPFLPSVFFVPLPAELRATAISQLGTD
jgi:Flp pilus assembly protein TadG